ncbi:MAG: hypothetical protein ACXWUG_10040 [Polyangiales bacterium]
MKRAALLLCALLAGCGTDDDPATSSGSSNCTVYQGTYGPCGWPSACNGYGVCEPTNDTGVADTRTGDASDASAETEASDAMDAVSDG